MDQPAKNLTDLGGELERSRLDRDLSKSAAAREMDISRMTYDMWERGAWVPDITNVGIIADFTGLGRDVVISTLLRMNGVIDESAYVEIRYGQR